MIQQHKITIYFEFSIIIENIIKIIINSIFIISLRCIIILGMSYRGSSFVGRETRGGGA